MGPLHSVIPLESLGPLQYSHSTGPQTKFFGRCLSHPVLSWRGGLKLTHLGGCQKAEPLMHGLGLPAEIVAIVGDGGSEVGEVVIVRRDEIDSASISSSMAMVRNLRMKSCSWILLSVCS